MKVLGVHVQRDVPLFTCPKLSGIIYFIKSKDDTRKREATVWLFSHSFSVRCVPQSRLIFRCCLQFSGMKQRVHNNSICSDFRSSNSPAVVCHQTSTSLSFLLFEPFQGSAQTQQSGARFGDAYLNISAFQRLWGPWMLPAAVKEHVGSRLLWWISLPVFGADVGDKHQ